MGWWTILLQGQFMHPWDALGDFLDTVIPILQQFPPNMMALYVVELHIVYLISLLTPKVHGIANQLLAHGSYNNLIAFTNQLHEKLD